MDSKKERMRYYSSMLFKDFGWRSDVSVAFGCKDCDYEVSITFRNIHDDIYKTTTSRQKFSFTSADSTQKIETILQQIYNYGTKQK